MESREGFTSLRNHQLLGKLCVWILGVHGTAVQSLESQRLRTPCASLEARATLLRMGLCWGSERQGRKHRLEGSQSCLLLPGKQQTNSKDLRVGSDTWKCSVTHLCRRGTCSFKHRHINTALELLFHSHSTLNWEGKRWARLYFLLLTPIL
jgi:hypothetical protein